jgi:hypothetical protein
LAIPNVYTFCSRQSDESAFDGQARPLILPIRRKSVFFLVEATLGGGGFMIDKTTKIILVVIALGVWVNVFTSSGRQAAAQHTDRNVSVIADNISWIAGGVCHNGKIC